MRDLFGNECETPVHINIYADEFKGKGVPILIALGIGIIVEKLDNPLLEDIILERFMGNFDTGSKAAFSRNQKGSFSALKKGAPPL